MRVTAETVDDFLVPQLEIEFSFHSRRAEQGNCNRVDHWRLTMHVGHVEKGSPLDVKFAVGIGGNRHLRQRQRKGIAREGPWLIAINVARKLVKNNDFRQSAVGRLTPAIKLATFRCAMHSTEARFDLPVEVVRSRPPLLGCDLLKPESKDGVRDVLC